MKYLFHSIKLFIFFILSIHAQFPLEDYIYKSNFDTGMDQYQTSSLQYQISFLPLCESLKSWQLKTAKPRASTAPLMRCQAGPVQLQNQRLAPRTLPLGLLRNRRNEVCDQFATSGSLQASCDAPVHSQMVVFCVTRVFMICLREN